jgi:Flp pilus assembly pilin Flp
MKKTSHSRLVKRYAAMTEYIIILALVAVGSIAIFTLFGDQIRSVIGNATHEMSGDASTEENVDSATVHDAVSKSIGDF